MTTLLDAENIDKLTPMPACDVLMCYGSSFGSPQGPARATPIAWVRAQSKPVWMIYFPGVNVAAARAEAASVDARGVAMDLESKYEGDAWSRVQCKLFGDGFAGFMDRVIYCHQARVGDLAPHYDGQWWPGLPCGTPLGPTDAVQCQYKGGYDLSNATGWYLGGDMTDAQAALLTAIGNQVTAIGDYVGPNGITGQLNAIKAELDAIKASLTAGGGGATPSGNFSGTVTFGP